MANRILGIRQLEEMLGITRTTIYRWQRDGNFPAPLKLGQRANRWREDEILNWLAEQRQGTA